MTLRDRLTDRLDRRGWPRVALWAVAPLLSLALPGLGVLLAFAWIVALLVLGRRPAASIGLGVRPRGWAALAAGLAVAVVLASEWVVEPLLRRLTHRAPDLSAFDGLAGHPGRLALLLAAGWLVGGVVEETVFRGFLIGYGQQVFGRRARWALALFSSIAFSLAHLYQGPVGMMQTGIVGGVLAIVYLATGGSLPTTMLMHGLVDTLAILAMYAGWNVPG